MKSIICWFIFLLFLQQSVSVDNTGECNTFLTVAMSQCSSQERPNKTINEFCEESSARIKNTKCGAVAGTTCGKNIKMAVFKQQLFATTMKNTIHEMIKNCCGTCSQCSIINEIEDLSQFAGAFNNTPDIIFPVINDEQISHVHGYHFIDVFQVPISYYFTLPKTSEEIIVELMFACLNMWPLFLVCIILSILSGFIIWLLDTYRNYNEFRRRFHLGMFDGFWWSFVSMTTVGYGDKTPKSPMAKIYAVFWILIGITIHGMLTGNLTSAITKAREPGNREIAGSHVGVLKHRLHDIAVVAQDGGILYQTQIFKTMRGINELLLLLENKTIDGFLIDKNTYNFFVSYSAVAKKHMHIAARLKRIKPLLTEKSIKSQHLKSGLLIKHTSVHKFFNAYFLNNQLQQKSCNSLRMNVIKEGGNGHTSIFSSDNDVFLAFIYWTMAILGALFLIGVFYELTKYFFEKRTNKIV